MSALAWLPAAARARRGLLLGVLACGVGTTVAQPAVGDDRGVALHFAAPPARIVSLVPSLTESLCALGACARLVGTDRYSNWPAEVLHCPSWAGWTMRSSSASWR